jgi:mRNA-degrading endonuclease RelE of RelBE toxin-antitoxin system
LNARVFKTTPQFRRALRSLSPDQKKAAKAAFQIFKENPFDPRLGTHKIFRLSAIMKRTVYAVEIQNDLRAVFYIGSDIVISFNIGKHAIYKS